MLRAARRLADERDDHRPHDVSRRPCAAARVQERSRRLYFASSPITCCPTLAAEGLVDAVDGFCERIAFSCDEMRYVFAAARRLRSAGQIARRAALQHGRRGARRRIRRAIGRSSRASGRGRRRGACAREYGRGAAARRLLLSARDAGAAGRALAQARMRDGGRNRRQPRHFAADLDPARAQHGGDACFV